MNPSTYKDLRNARIGNLRNIWYRGGMRNKLLLIIILASALRLFFLSSVPPSLNWDEVSMGYTAYSVAKTGMDEWGERLPIFFRSYGEWKSAVYIYLLVPMVNFFGLNAWTVRLPSAIAGILAVYLTYLIGRHLYGRQVGLYAALFLAISPWHLVLSRPAFEANVSLTLILAGLYYFLHYIQVSQSKFLIFSAVFFGLAPHTYNSAKVIVPFLVIYLLWQTRLYRSLRSLLIYLGILGLFALPLALNLFTGRAQHRYTQVGVSTDQYGLSQFVAHRQNPALPPLIGKLAFNKYTYTLHSFAGNYLSYLSPAFLLVQAGDHNQHHVKYFGVLYLAEFIFVLYGLRKLRGGKTNLSRSLPLVIIGLGIIPAALTRDEGHVLRSLLTLPGWQLLAALGAAELFRAKLNHWRLLIGILIIQSILFLTAYFYWYPTTFARDWQYGHREVAQFLAEHEGDYDRIVMTKWFGEPQLFLAFFNRWDPSWYLAENRANLRYESEGKLWLDQLEEYTLGKYTFKYIEFAKEEPDGKTLYIGKFDDFWENPRVLKTIYFPDGTVAFHLLDAK